MPLFDALVDDFAGGLNGTRWPAAYGSTVANGRVQIPSDTSYPTLASARGYTLTGSSILAEVSPAPAGDATGGGPYSKFSIEHTTGGTELVFEHKPGTGTLSMGNHVGWWENGRPTVTYDPAAMRWLRFREAGGTVHWETSPDGNTWTIRRSLTTPAWVADGTARALFQTYRDTGTMGAQLMLVDNVNNPPATAPAGHITSLLMADGTWQNVRWQLIT